METKCVCAEVVDARDLGVTPLCALMVLAGVLLGLTGPNVHACVLNVNTPDLRGTAARQMHRVALSDLLSSGS